MRVGLSQIDPTVGDFAGNVRLIRAAIERAVAGGADLLVLPELALTGYPPRDLVDRDLFVERGMRALYELCGAVPASLTVLVGFVEGGADGETLYNAAAVVRDGRIEQVIRKRLLPTYDVFDEDRYFEPGPKVDPIEVAGRRVGVTICEDIWNDDGAEGLQKRRYPDNPPADLLAAGAELLVNLSASPFTLEKRLGRRKMLAGIAARHRVPLIFVNQVGGNDDLIFDGDSAIYGPDGSTRARLARFEEDFAVVPLEGEGPVAERADSEEADALDALTLGVRDYATKCGFRGALVGLSGGIDSALTACIAARALGPEQVTGFAMPTRYSSQSSLDDAETLARALGIRYHLLPVDTLFEAYLQELTPTLEGLAAPGPADVTFENIQARIRGNVLMAASNRTGWLLLTTGNKSEIAVGYATLYGDMCGGLAVISDLVKTRVYAVSREVNRQAGRALIPESTLEKPPSAELRPDQRDSDSLPAYSVLDPILQLYVEQGASAERMVDEGHDPAIVERVIAMVHRSEYKRRQMPPSLIVTRKAFGPGRRYPIAQRFDG